MKLKTLLASALLLVPAYAHADDQQPVEETTDAPETDAAGGHGGGFHSGGAPGGFHPGGGAPGGFHPGGGAPGGFHPGGGAPGGFHPGGGNPGGFHPGGGNPPGGFHPGGGNPGGFHPGGGNPPGGFHPGGFHPDPHGNPSSWPHHGWTDDQVWGQWGHWHRDGWAGWGRRHGPDAYETDLFCGSYDGSSQECTVNGVIQDAWVTEQFSDAGCYENQTWGVNEWGLWVSEYCQAEFHVVYLPHY